MQVLSARDAVELVKSGDTVVVSGIVSLIAPEAAVKALGDRFRETGSPRDLTVICPCRTGWGAGAATTGLEHLAQSGLVKRMIASSFNGRDTPRLLKQILDNEIETYSLPLGVLFRWLRECTARSPGLLTEVGMGTYFDPASRDAGDIRVHPHAQPLDLVKRVQVDGTDCIFIRSIPVNVTFVRGTIADADGNIGLAGEPISAGVKQMAMAAKTSGGKVIAVVKTLVERGTLHPRMVEIPGIFVDAVVVDACAIQSQLGYEPAFTGEIRMPQPLVPALPLNHQKVIVRRVALEMKRGNIVNLGVGMGTLLPSVALEEGFLDDLHLSVEHGAIGGIPAMGVPGQTGAFGANFNPQAIMDSTDLMDFYHGGGLDAAVLGFAQIDGCGNANVAWFNGSLRGPGGFVDITHRTKNIFLCGTLTSGGLEVKIENNDAGAPRLTIVREGRHKKFLKRVEQVNLHGVSAVNRGQRILIITERCVFEMRRSGLTLLEIAPGIDVDKHIRPLVEFELSVATELKTMRAEIFRSGRMNISLRERQGGATCTYPAHRLSVLNSKQE